mmetsp:Transcript_38607/g.83545  ORF Transcript_38607/g.83545 Transcript_38607/m.83545 type:complete len:201 (-) Transcript_38607:382-984(-)
MSCHCQRMLTNFLALGLCFGSGDKSQINRSITLGDGGGVLSGSQYFASRMAREAASWNGCFRYRRAKRMQPNIQMSTAQHTGYRRYKSTISGGRYMKVVFLVTSSCSFTMSFTGTSVRSKDLSLQLPKSTIFQNPSWPRRTFSSFKSRCCRGGRCEWRQKSASATSVIALRRSGSGSSPPWLSRKSSNVPPGQSSSNSKT